ICCQRFNRSGSRCARFAFCAKLVFGRLTVAFKSKGVSVDIIVLVSILVFGIWIVDPASRRAQSEIQGSKAEIAKHLAPKEGNQVLLMLGFYLPCNRPLKPIP